MTNEQWNSIAACIAGFFPTMAERLTHEQTREWRKALDPCDPDRIKAAIGRWYQRDPSGSWPVLAKIVEAARPAEVVRGWKPPPDAKRQAAEEVRRQCEIGREMLRQRKLKREQQQVQA